MDRRCFHNSLRISSYSPELATWKWQFARHWWKIIPSAASDQSRAQSRWGCGWMNPIHMGSTLPIVKAMGGWVKRLYEVEMKIRRRIVWGEECERWCEDQDDNRNQRDVALVYTRRHTWVMATRVFPPTSRILRADFGIFADTKHRELPGAYYESYL